MELERPQMATAYDHAGKIAEIPVSNTMTVTFLVSAIETKVDRNGNDFCEVLAAENESTTKVRLWNKSTDDVDFGAGSVITAPVTASPYHDTVTYSFKEWALESPDRASEFIRLAPLPVPRMWSWIENRVSQMRFPVRDIVETLLFPRKEEFCRAAAAKSLHHGYIGGLIYHSYRMALSADALAPIYNADADIAVAGALIHDIGKLEEMRTDSLGQAEYTLLGQMEHHLLIGIRLLDAAVESLGGEEALPGDDVLCLRHVIASHHGDLDKGAIVEPMTKEAMLVSALDMLDMKLSVYDEETDSSPVGTMSLNQNPVIGRVYIPQTYDRKR